MKKVVLVLSVVIVLGGIAYYSYEQAPLTKEDYDLRIAERYEQIYSDNYKTDENEIREEERAEMEVRVAKRLEGVRASYWKEAKEIELSGVKEFVEASPEVISYVVDFEKIESQQYKSLDDFFIKNYPTSRFIGFDFAEACEKNNVDMNRCVLSLAIAGKESAFDTAYRKHNGEIAVTEGKAMNNPFGLKPNRRWADLKGETTTLPKREFSLAYFDSFGSGVDWFLSDTMEKGYPSVTNPYQMVGYYNSNPLWANDIQHFINILEPLFNL